MNTEQIIHLKCLICGKTHPPKQGDYVCRDHGNEGILDVVYDYHSISRHISRETLEKSRIYNMWRYKPLLPVRSDSEVPPLAIGWTPLYNRPDLARKHGIRNLFFKDDARQPTASFKDRASAVAVVKAREAGAKVITTASTGNAAAALSGICASMDQRNVIFVPESAPEAKIVQLLVYGSQVILVEGTYDDAFELCLDVSREYGWYNRNTGYNPYMTEGKKTAAFEICEQLAWEAPDRIFVSVGDGCIIGGLHKGLKDLYHLGWIREMPKLMGVQARGSSYLYQAWKEGEDVVKKPAVKAETVADSISSGLPRDRIKAMTAVKESRGAYICVEDREILDAMPRLARETGIFAEPAGAAAYAGFLKAMDTGMVSSDETVVVLNTGNGLKDIQGAVRALEMDKSAPLRISPSLKAFQEAMGRPSL